MTTIKYFQILIGVIFTFFTNNVCAQRNENMVLTVYPDTVIHKMQGGIGASWHAISKEFPLENHLYKYPVREENPRGSATKSEVFSIVAIVGAESDES